MNNPYSRSSSGTSHTEVLVSVSSVLVAAVLGWYSLRHALPVVTAASTPAAVETMRPGFGAVQINAQGIPVISGRALPNTFLTIRSGDQILGTARADARGDWTFTPTTALPPGNHSLSLSARLPDGQELANIASMMLAVPERAIAGLPAGTAGTQQAAGAGGVNVPAGGAARLGMIGYGPGGQLNFAGTALPGSLLRLFLNDAQVGEATADASGQWKLIPNSVIAPGTYKLRVEQIGSDGTVASRVELPFLRESEDRVANMDGRIVVQPGQTLSQIAQAAYNDSSRYMAIFEANRDQLNDPNRIFPGQILTLPR